ncbi:nucleotidyltransferase domain-containing protein, partial [Candidatus Woesearchaeota archaeon]|nr:nucleotidyltransferase domain-containing protein [Candidatus Woesearchaeota archaeon]
MEFKIQRRAPAKQPAISDEDLELAYKFTNRIYKEYGDFLKGVVLFGSAARKQKEPNDIDILIIVDDVSLQLTQEVAETYRIILEKVIVDLSTRLHVTSLRLSSFWEYIRVGDPIGINMLRDGMPLLDTGIFRPMQLLLNQGRIRPSPESIWTYFTRAPTTLHNSRWHLMQASLDLYWAVIDSAHAALMKLDEIPPSPDHIAEMLDKKLVQKGHVNKKCIITMKKFYKLSKQIL